MTHREAIKDYLGKIKLENKLVLDWGSGSKPASRYIQHENCKFITIDRNPLIAEDRRAEIHIQADIQKPLDTPKADIAFCIEVLEHTEDFRSVIKNIVNNLKGDGVLYLSVPFMFPQHSEDDYWRFTENGIAKLLLPYFSFIDICETNGQDGYFVEARMKK